MSSARVAGGGCEVASREVRSSTGDWRWTTRDRFLLLLVIATLSRLLLQNAALPPYAGLDEVFHVARLSFSAAEGRQPAADEPSVPRYIDRSIAREPGALVAFGFYAKRWRSIVPQLTEPVEEEIGAEDMRPYRRTNYEAQQPALYYALAAPLVRLLPYRSARTELILWRMLSVAFALVTVLATALAGFRLFGPAGIIAAALLPSIPTWLTLVVRAGNDALCCALLALGIAVTLSRPERLRGQLAEAAFWGLAAATKLYAWPVMVLLPVAFYFQKASRRRIVVVLAVCAISVVVTAAELGSRTSNPLGLFAFDPSAAEEPAEERGIDWITMVKTTVATAAWTSGQHWNALTPVGIVLYVAPLIAFLIIGAQQLAKDRSRRYLLGVIAAAALGFFIAQLVSAAAYIRLAQAAGESLPAGGKEGWYWFSFAPLVLASIGAAAASRLHRLALAALVIWVVAWDIQLSELGLFRDFGGLASADTPGVLLRWGLPEPATYSDMHAALVRVAVGPLTGSIALLRGIHLAALAALLLVVASKRNSGHSAAADGRGPAARRAALRNAGVPPAGPRASGRRANRTQLRHSGFRPAVISFGARNEV